MRVVETTNTRGKPKRDPQFFGHITDDQREIVGNQVRLTNEKQISVASMTTPTIVLGTSAEIQELLQKNLMNVRNNLNDKISHLKFENSLMEIIGRLQRIEDKVDRLTATTKAIEKKHDLKTVSSSNLPDA